MEVTARAGEVSIAEQTVRAYAICLDFRKSVKAGFSTSYALSREWARKEGRLRGAICSQYSAPAGIPGAA